MFKKLKKGITKQVKGLVNKVTGEDHPMKKYVDMALNDGILTEREREMLFEKAKKLEVDEIDFEFYLESELEKVKKENMKKIIQLIEKSNKDGVITDKEKEIIYQKAKELHLKKDDVYLEIKARLDDIKTDVKKNNMIDEIPAMISEAKLKNESVVTERKQRQQRHKNKIKKYQSELEKYSKSKITKNLTGWWKNKTKEEKEHVRVKAEIQSRLFKPKPEELIEMYYKENYEEKEKEKQKEIIKHLDDSIENEIELLEIENNKLKDVIKELHTIPNDKYKEFKIDKLTAKIEANINVDIKIYIEIQAKINIDGAKMTTAFLKGIESILSNKVAMKGIKTLLPY